MKPYFAYAIGHALLDLEWRVSEEALKKNQLEKSFRSLINYESLQQHLKKYSPADAIHCGGSIANSCAVIANFGGSTFLQCKLINDSAGNIYLAELQKFNIETAALIDDPTLHTGHCLAWITPDGERTMQTYLGAANHFRAEDFHLEKIAHSKYLLLESYLFNQENIISILQPAILHAKKHHVQIALSLSDINMVTKYQTEIIALLPWVDFIFANQDEITAFNQKNIFLFPNIKWLITQGAKGVDIFYQGHHQPIEAIKNINIIDKLGAGDAFAGAFLIAFDRWKNLEKAAMFANRVAAQIISKWGARLNSDEINRLVAFL